MKHLFRGDDMPRKKSPYKQIANKDKEPKFYEIKDFGITLPTAYARLTNVSIDINGNAFGMFEIHQTREDIHTKKHLERQNINCIIKMMSYENKNYETHNCGCKIS